MDALFTESLERFINNGFHDTTWGIISVACDICHIAVLAEKWNKGNKSNNFAFSIFCIKISFVHGMIESDGSHGERQQRTFFLSQPFMSDAVKRCFDVWITVGQRTIFMDGNTGFFAWLIFMRIFAPFLPLISYSAREKRASSPHFTEPKPCRLYSSRK